MYMAQKGLIRWNTPKHRKQPRNTPNHLLYLFFTLNYFVYLLSQVEWGIKDVW